MDEAACSSTGAETMEPQSQGQDLRTQAAHPYQEEDKQSNGKDPESALTKQEKVKLKRKKRKEKKKERRRQLKEMGHEDDITLNRTKRRKLKARERKLEKRWDERRKKDEEERNEARFQFYRSSSSDD